MTTITLNNGSFAFEQWISTAVDQVKSRPTQLDSRWQLITLYCLQADWSRAMSQLTTVLKIDSEQQQQVELIRNLIFSEQLRAEVLAGKRRATPLQQSLPQWAQWIDKANQLYADAQQATGEVLRQRALEQADALSGSCYAWQQFSWLADSDDRLGPICEFIGAGGYRWLPCSQIESLTVTPPTDLQHMIWAPTTLVVSGCTWRGYMPSRYPLSLTDQPQIKAGLETQWTEQGERFIGHGRKMWMSSAGESSIFETGTIRGE